MANTIRIKRSASTNTPSSLLQGEVANSEVGSPNGINELFIGTAGPTVFKLIRNLNGAPAEPTAGLASATFNPAADYLPFEDADDSQAKRSLWSGIASSVFTGSNGIDVVVTDGVADASLDFADLTDMTGSISGTTEFILQDGTTESRKAASEIALSFFNNDSAWTSDLQLFHATYAFDSSTTAADPGAGNIRFNSATPASVTALYIDDLEDNGNDWGWILSNLGSNDIIAIKSYVDAADYLIVQVNSGPTDNTGYWTVPVTVLFSGSLPTATDTLQIDVQWFSQGTAGTVTSVTAGTGLINSGSASAVVLDLDFSELTDMTGSIAGTTEFILQDSTTESRKAASEIDLSFFDNATTSKFTGFRNTVPADNALVRFDGATGLFVQATGIIVADTTNNVTGMGTLNGKTIANLVSTTDTGSATWTWIIDDDTFATASATTVPTSESVKAYVDDAVVGGLVYQGAFDPTGVGTPNLDSITSTTGDTYTVTVAGTYNWTTGSAVLEVGDVLIAEADGVLNNVASWTIVQNNMVAASYTTPGYVTAPASTTTEQEFKGTKVFDFVKAKTEGTSTIDLFLIDGGTF